MILNEPLDSLQMIGAENDTLVLKCNASGHPEPFISWMPSIQKNHQSIDSIPEINMANGLTSIISTLTFSPLSRDDTGSYTCTANNSVHGQTVEESGIYHLTVNCEFSIVFLATLDPVSLS